MSATAHTDPRPTVPLVALNYLRPSPTNPRRRFTEASIAELAASIAEHEVLQPVLARPDPAGTDATSPLEIVAGERRWRACSTLTRDGRNPHGDQIPCIVRDLTDRQVLELQLVENIQREDLHPMEEADHYHRMRSLPGGGMTIDEIAHAAGKPTQHVSNRLALLALVPAAREAFMSTAPVKLSARTALLLARMPAHLQEEALAHLVDWGGEPMGPLAAAKFLRERYTLRLASAPFEPADAELLPAAGACGACPKRSGANPQLFDDITDADTCTDPQCFAQKKAAQHERVVAELQASGFNVLREQAARDVCTPDGRHLKPGYHLLEGTVPHALGDATLKVVDVLTRAEAPNTATCVVDHPGNPVLVYAVATDKLEYALRKIKAHRVQLDAAATKVAKKAAQAREAAPPQEPLREAKASDVAADEDGEPLDAFGGPLSAWHKTGKQDAPVGPTDEEVEELLAFEPEAGFLSEQRYTEQQLERAATILSAAAVARRLRTDAAEGLPSEGLGAALITLMLYGDTALSLPVCAAWSGIEYSPPRGSLNANIDWAWALSDEDASRVALVMLAAQQDGHGVDRIPPAVAAAIGADISHVETAARESVAKYMQLGALKTGTAGKPTTKTASKPASRPITKTTKGGKA